MKTKDIAIKVDVPLSTIYRIIKKAVQKAHKSGDTVDVLIKNIEEAWENILMDVINTLVETMPTHVNIIKKNKEKSTRY